MLENYQRRATHRDYEIYLRSPGFEFTPMGLQKIASFLIQDSSGGVTVAAFAYSVLALLETRISEDLLLSQAIELLEGVIEDGQVRDRQDSTYEYRNGAFVTVTKPPWWLPSFE